MSLFEKNVQPDFEGFRRCILGEEIPKRVFFAELIIDPSVVETLVNRFDLGKDIREDDPFASVKKLINFNRFMGYDMVEVKSCSLPFTFQNQRPEEGDRPTTDPYDKGPIQNWSDFEKYPWPDVSQVDFRELEWLEKNLPPDMKCYLQLPVGFYKLLIGYETMSYMIYDQPDLFLAVIDKLKGIFSRYAKIVCEFSCVGVIWNADDMGFKTQTFFPPDFIRERILPLHSAVASIAHNAKKLFFLHSCGNLEKIMPDLINEVHIDAKHSFEESILPVTEAKRKYGSNIALIGGIDLDVLCRSPEKELRRYVRQTLEYCQKGGRYALGSGNSIADYVPIDNFLIMLDEGRRYFS